LETKEYNNAATVFDVGVLWDIAYSRLSLQRTFLLEMGLQRKLFACCGMEMMHCEDV